MENLHALVLAAGKGRRMQSEIHKHFLMYRGEALFLKSVRAFLACGIPVTVVTGEEDIPEVRRLLSEAGLPGNEGSEKNGCPEVFVAAGGTQRYDSSYRGLLSIEERGGTEIVLIHDAARPFVTEEIIGSAVESVRRFGSGVAAVPSKDTVKIADEQGFVIETPKRQGVYIVQTPQAFYFREILAAYRRMFGSGEDFSGITDDASVMEQYGTGPVRLSPGNYANIKITTPEDLKFLG